MTARTPQFMQWTAQFPPAFAVPQFTEQVFGAYRNAFNAWLSMANCMLSGAEHMRMTQLATDVETLQENRRAATAAAGAHDLNGLLAVQQALAREYLEGCAKYWSAMAELVQGTQAEMARIVSQNAGQVGSAWQAAVQPAATMEKKAA